jgi:uncharacterized Zn finger protein
MKNRGPEEKEAVCPMCGEEVQSVWATDAATPVAVTCPNCGRLELSKEEFDVFESDVE